MIAKFIRNVGKCAKKQSVVIIVLTNLFGKKSPRVNKNFFQVTLVEKGHLGNISRPWPSASASKTFPWCPFSTSVTWKKFLFTLGQFFLTICPDNFDNKILLLHTIYVFQVSRWWWHFFMTTFNRNWVFPWNWSFLRVLYQMKDKALRIEFLL